MNISQDRNGFLVCKTSQDQIFEAKRIFTERFSNSLSLNGRTVYDRMESRMAGIVGEIVYQALFPTAQKTPNKDIPFDFYHNDEKVDVKCKYRKVAPKDNFEASFFAYQMSGKFQTVDKYVFMSTRDSFSTVWICGYLYKKDFINKSVFWRKGQADPTNNKVFHEDTFSVFYSQLNKYELRN